MILIKQRSDILGATISSLCIVHCSITPLFLVTLSSATNFSEIAPNWWPIIDYLFLLVSFFAIYRSTQNTTIHWMKPSLWVSWLTLFLVIINEKTEWLSLINGVNFIPAFALIILHLYNKKHCQCNKKECCINKV